MPYPYRSPCTTYCLQRAEQREGKEWRENKMGIRAQSEGATV